MKRRQEKRNVIVGTAVRPNAGIRAWYREKLLALTKEMTDTVRRKMARVYGKYEEQILPAKAAQDANISSRAAAELRKLQNEITKLYAEKADQIAKGFVSKTDQYANRTVRESVKGMVKQNPWVGISVNGSKMTPSMAAVMKAEIYNNVNYIKSIPAEYFQKIAGAVFRNIAEGKSADEIEKALRYTGKIAQRRAELIARDQSQKAFESLSREHMKAAGITHFEWVATGGGLYPRKLHHTHYTQGGLNHGIFSFDDPPVIDEGYTPKTPRGTARPPQRGFPGDLPYCQCIKRPVLVLEKGQILA